MSSFSEPALKPYILSLFDLIKNQKQSTAFIGDAGKFTDLLKQSKVNFQYASKTFVVNIPTDQNIPYGSVLGGNLTINVPKFVGGLFLFDAISKTIKFTFSETETIHINWNKKVAFFNLKESAKLVSAVVSESGISVFTDKDKFNFNIFFS